MVTQSWSKTSRYFLLTLMLAGLVWFVVAAKELIGPLVISALLAYVLNPAVKLVNEKGRLPRKWVVPLVYIISLAVLVTLAVLLAPIIPEQIASLVQELQRIVIQLEAPLAQPVQLFGIQISLENLIIDSEVLSADFVRPDMIVGVISAASENLAWILIILVTTYFIMQDWPKLREWTLNLAPAFCADDVHRLYGEVSEVWQKYLLGQLRLMIVIGVVTGLGSAVIGLPGAAAFGLLAGLLDVILTVGPMIATGIAALVAYFAGSTFLPVSNLWFTVIVIALYTAIKIAEDVWLRPRIMGNTLHMHPAVVFIAIMGALALAGVLVALIIIPLVRSVFIVGHYAYCRIFEMDPWDEDADKPPKEEREPEPDPG